MTTPTETRLREAVKLLRAACEPIIADASQRVRFWEDDWNPEYGVAITLTIRELRIIRNALAATSDLYKEPTP